MGRDIRKMRIAGRERTRRYRERLREGREPTSDVIHRAIRRALAEVLAQHQGPDARAVARFLADVANLARRNLVESGYDSIRTRERIRRAIMPVENPERPLNI